VPALTFPSSSLAVLFPCPDLRVRTLPPGLDSYLTNATVWHIKMKKYSISEAARICGVDRRTLHRWLGRKQIPVPRPEIVDGQLRKSWSAAELAEILEYKKASYWGKGIDRRTGKKAKKK